mmetsp:Transcript_83952/g.168133  ORF Transcript_83952/g.168133 Transcript_83952/m.168133 type:complete len:566 (+) Transcript_83952:65-1762(+)
MNTVLIVLLMQHFAKGTDQVAVLGSQARRIIASKDRFLCVTMDYWPSDKYSTNPDAHYPWRNSSVYTADFTNPTLRSALAALAPINLRVGGSLADQIVFNVSEGVSTECAPPLADTSDIQGYTQGCLPSSRYAELHSLCADTGCGIIFGLNGLYGRLPDPNSEEIWSGPWDPANAEALLRFTKDSGMDATLVGVELGNEIDGAAGISAKLSPDEYASSFTKLKALLAEVWPGGTDDDGGNKERPMLIGPDSSGFSDSWWFPQFLGNLSIQETELDVITWHLYFLGSGNSSEVAGEVLNATYLNLLAPKCQKHHDTLEPFTNGETTPQFWLGEGGGAWGSGQDGTTNTFLSTFWFADSLGTLAATGNDAFCRQALIGGNYALLQLSPDSNSLSPNPDFYLALLWRMLMGDVVLSAFARQEEDSMWRVGGNGTQGSLRTYSHCARLGDDDFSSFPLGSVAVVLVNLSEDSRSVDLLMLLETPIDNVRGIDKDSHNTEDMRYEWHLTSTSLESHETLLNGVQLKLDDADGTVQLPLQPIAVSASSPVSIGPHSTAFLVLPAADAKACL